MTLTPVQRFCAWLGLFVLTWFNAVAGGGASSALRFTVPLLNYLFFFLAQLIPFHLLAIADRWRGRNRLAAMTLVVPLLLVAAPSACGASACVLLGRGMLSEDPSFSKVREVPTPRGRVVVYRTNGGAMTNFGVVVHQECAVIPRVLVIQHQLLRQYPAFDADVAVGTGGKVVIVTDATTPRRVEATLRRWPCLVEAG